MKLTKSYKSKEKSYKKELQKQRKASGNGKLYNLRPIYTIRLVVYTILTLAYVIE